MSALLLEGKPVAEVLKEQLSQEVLAFRNRWGRPPCLAGLRVGDDPSVLAYARRIARTHESLGISFLLRELPAEAEVSQVRETLTELAQNPQVDAILPLLPFPKPLGLETFLDLLPPEKDAEGLHPINAGNLFLGQPTVIPNTPAGGMEVLHYYRIPIEGKKAVVVGRSNIVGKPMALLLLRENATVTLCHTRTRSLPEEIRQAEILVVAIGQPEFIRGEWLQPGVVVIDFGINPTDRGIVGDVHFESAKEVAGAITPVPGGTGPVTNLMLARNVLQLAQLRQKPTVG